MFLGVSKWWPSVEDLDGARKAIRAGYRLSFGVAAIYAAFSLGPLFGGPAHTENIISALIFLALGWGVRRRSRLAVVIGLTMLAAGALIAIVDGQMVGLTDGVALLAMLNAARGVWAFR